MIKKLDLIDISMIMLISIQKNVLNDNPNNLVSLCRVCHNKTNSNRDF
jgi:hypothetical protein